MLRAIGIGVFFSSCLLDQGLIGNYSNSVLSNIQDRHGFNEKPLQRQQDLMRVQDMRGMMRSLAR